MSETSYNGPIISTLIGKTVQQRGYDEKKFSDYGKIVGICLDQFSIWKFLILTNTGSLVNIDMHQISGEYYRIATE